MLKGSVLAALAEPSLAPTWFVARQVSGRSDAGSLRRFSLSVYTDWEVAIHFSASVE